MDFSKFGQICWVTKVGKTDDWLSALNFTMDIPDRFNPLAIFPVKIPLKVFTDIGTFNEVWKKESTNLVFSTMWVTGKPVPKHA